MQNVYIKALVDYALREGLIEKEDKIYAINSILAVLDCNEYNKPEFVPEMELKEILEGLITYAVDKKLINDSIVEKDLFDTKIMSCITPRPSTVVNTFNALKKEDAKKATDYFYKLSCDCDYIRRYRIKKDIKWVYESEYGDLDITINLSKPEKDPKAIAAMKNMKQSGYPVCQLCKENVGYRGRLDFPARQTLRTIPLNLGGENWRMQYSPYVYYNEHCIVFNEKHIPMRIDRRSFVKLLDFITEYPHYFIGSNADLPIVGGSILSHDHFQGGNYTFAMEKAPVEIPLSFIGFPDVQAGIVKWPMSVIRLTGADPAQITKLAGKILTAWRGYSDASVGVIAFSDGEPHNTITPIARRRGEAYELDLVLRCNITTQEHPMGVFHPHADKHHIKKENIGLIEVMGLAVLPSRLKNELTTLAEAVAAGRDIAGDAVLGKHADWVEELKKQYTFTEHNALDIILQETGKVFAAVLEDAGVYKNTPEGREAFRKFVNYIDWEA